MSHLSTRTRNALTSHGITDFKQLSKKRRNIFVTKKGIGASTIKEVELFMVEFGIHWKPPLESNKEEMIEKIISAMNYRDGSYYMGSLATAHICSLARTTYPCDNIKEALEKAKIEHVTDVYYYIEDQGFFDHMEDHPIVYCPICGCDMHEEQFVRRKKDLFMIQFSPGYVQTLTKNVGIDKAKERLLEEGTVALKIQLDQMEE
jgi:hypothetical protein